MTEVFLLWRKLDLTPKLAATSSIPDIKATSLAGQVAFQPRLTSEGLTQVS